MEGLQIPGPWVGCSGCLAGSYGSSVEQEQGGQGSWARWARSSRSFPDLVHPPPPRPTVAGTLKETAFCGCGPHLLRLCSNPDFPSIQSIWSEHFSNRLALGKHTGSRGQGRLQNLL